MFAPIAKAAAIAAHAARVSSSCPGDSGVGSATSRPCPDSAAKDSSPRMLTTTDSDASP